MMKKLRIAEVRPGRNGALICSVCDKASFATEELARSAAEGASGKLYYYLGPECRWWHLTRSPPKGGDDE